MGCRYETGRLNDQDEDDYHLLQRRDLRKSLNLARQLMCLSETGARRTTAVNTEGLLGRREARVQEPERQWGYEGATLPTPCSPHSRGFRLIAMSGMKMYTVPNLRSAGTRESGGGARDSGADGGKAQHMLYESAVTWEFCVGTLRAASEHGWSDELRRELSFLFVLRGLGPGMRLVRMCA